MPAVAAASAPTAETVTPAKAITKKDLVAKFILLAQEKDREVAVKLLAEYGVSKLPELTDKSLWPAFVAKIDALLAA